MEDSTNKALLIGVGIFVSIMVVSPFIFIISKVVNVYKMTEKVNIDLLNVNDEFEMYIDEDSIFYGVDVINTYRKYKNNEFVEVHLGKGVKLENEDDVDKNKIYTPVVIDGNNVLEGYEGNYSSSQYKDKTIILFE